MEVDLPGSPQECQSHWIILSSEVISVHYPNVMKYMNHARLYFFKKIANLWIIHFTGTKSIRFGGSYFQLSSPVSFLYHYKATGQVEFGVARSASNGVSVYIAWEYYLTITWWLLSNASCKNTANRMPSVVGQPEYQYICFMQLKCSKLCTLQVR